MKRTILVSGGLDSTVLLHHSLRSSDPSSNTAVSVDYGQPHPLELEYAKDLCRRLGVKHHVLAARHWNQVPEPKRVNDIPWMPGPDDPMVVRGRNSLFVSVAYIVEECDEIWLGCNFDDQRDYPDCREAWADAISKVFGVQVRLPLAMWSKREIVEMAKLYHIDLETTLSCYRGWSTGCGVCNACVLLAEATKQ